MDPRTWVSASDLMRRSESQDSPARRNGWEERSGRRDIRSRALRRDSLGHPWLAFVYLGDGGWRKGSSADQKILLQTPKSTSKSTPFVLRIPTYILYQEIWAGMTRGGSSGPRSLDTRGATTTSSTFEQHHGHSTRFHLLHQPTTTNHLNNYHTILFNLIHTIESDVQS